MTGKESALALQVTQQRFSRAIRSGKIRPDFVANAADLFFPATIKTIRRKNIFRPIPQ
jgi:hypothetical protein